jgi:hypothetical protein
MAHIPTAKEFALKDGWDKVIDHVTIKRMREFAKMHVEEALKNAYDCHTFKGWTNSEDENVHKELFIKNIMSRQPIL